MNADFMAAGPTEDIWTKTMDFLNMPDWLKLEMVQSAGAKIVHVIIWLVISWILLKLFCQVLRKITSMKMSPQASRLTVKIVKNAGYIIIGVEAFALMGFDILTLLGAASIIGVAVGFASQTSLSNIISGLFDFPRTREESRQRRRPYSRVTFTLLLAIKYLMASAACILLMVPCFTRRDSTSTSFPARISSTFLASTASFSFCMAPSRAFCSTSREEILARASCSAWLTKVLALAPCLFSQALRAALAFASGSSISTSYFFPSSPVTETEAVLPEGE